MPPQLTAINDVSPVSDGEQGTPLLGPLFSVGYGGYGGLGRLLSALCSLCSIPTGCLPASPILASPLLQQCCSSVAAAGNTALKLCGPRSSSLGAYGHTPHCKLEHTSDSVASRTLVALLLIPLPVRSSSSIQDLSIVSPSKSRFLSTNHQKCHFLPLHRRARDQIQLDSGSHDASDSNLH